MIYAVYVGDVRKAGFTTREAAASAAGLVSYRDGDNESSLVARIVEEPEYVTPEEAVGDASSK